MTLPFTPPLFERFADSIRSLPSLPEYGPEHLCTPTFRLYSDGGIELFYAPVDSPTVRRHLGGEESNMAKKTKKTKNPETISYYCGFCGREVPITQESLAKERFGHWTGEVFGKGEYVVDAVGLVITYLCTTCHHRSVEHSRVEPSVGSLLPMRGEILRPDAPGPTREVEGMPEHPPSGRSLPVASWGTPMASDWKGGIVERAHKGMLRDQVQLVADSIQVERTERGGSRMRKSRRQASRS